MQRGTGPVLAAIAVGAAIVAAGVSLLLVGIVDLRRNANTELRSGALLVRVLAVERSIIDAETGLRGYVITSSGTFLSPLRAAERALPGEASALERATAHQHDHAAAARALANDARAYMASYVPHMLALVRAAPARARSYAVTLAGKRRVDAIRNRAGALERAFGGERAFRQHSANATAGDDITYGVIVLVVLVLLTIVIEGVLGRLLLGRQEALRRSRGTAHTLQTALLPLLVPDIPGCELAIRFAPAGIGGVVGGDFYDVFELDAPNRWAVVVGDVCGKDAAAAATTAVARWTLRSASLLTPTPTDALRHLNEVMLRRRQRSLFATIVYLLLEIDSGGVTVTVACAGHPPPIVLASGRPPAPVPAHGDLLGIWPEVRLHTSEVRLAPGDLIVAYTDGATDFSADPLDPLERFLRDADTSSAGAVAEAIEARALVNRPVPRDDVAVVAIQFTGSQQAASHPTVSVAKQLIGRTPAG